jgi:hypothetical protein
MPETRFGQAAVKLDGVNPGNTEYGIDIIGSQ